MSADRIEREITIAAPVERVWAVLTEPEHVGQWFGQGKPTEVDLRPGGVMVLDHGENGMFPARIEKVDPPYFLSYRWASAYPGEETTEDNSTLVEFTLSPDGEGTGCGWWRAALRACGYRPSGTPTRRTRATRRDGPTCSRVCGGTLSSPRHDN